ncbi:hypothetical protein BHM03_00023890 [Ensete ventricosum]|uniref:Protein FAR1-RELATED SEQUENCE n=1 Tax=Ensete ventricosum TaxID=4639 RepID=A0A426ZSH9_ENSVE|nr:hypothetical protein B296_00039054 [Ensete ventricosum]RZR95083.1 hypothetical protein BHM03_00023890 [Ensete ventricosum]
MEDDELDDGNAGAEVDDRVPEVGMVFKNHQEVSRFYKRYARRVGFGIAIRRSAFTEDGHCLYLELMCCKGGRNRPEAKYRKRNSAKTNCPARIKVKLWGDGMLHLVVANIDHNHPVSPSMARFLSCYRQLSGAAKKRAERNKDGETVQPRLPPRMPIERLSALEELLFSESEHRKQLSRVYTLNMFKKFQDEIEAIMYCHASLVNVDGPVSTFDVKECIFLDDGKRTMNKNHGVLYNTEEKEIQCICGSFQFRGILCRHALSVLKWQQVHEIPSQYVLDRWKKDFKRLHVLARSSDDVIANNRVDRYDYLSMRCLQLVEVGVLSDKYQLALKLIKEVEKFLLSDKTHDDTQPRIKLRVPKANRLNRNHIQNAGKSVASENGNAVQLLGGQPQMNEAHGEVTFI